MVYTNYKGRSLTDNEIARIAPSVFATEAHESRSDKYAFIPTSEVLNDLRREGYQVFGVQQSRTRIEGKQNFTRHLLRLRHPEFTARALEVGQVQPEILLSNSHDGSSGYQLSAGLFRLVCLNGMAVPETVVSDVRVRHSGTVSSDVIDGCIKVVSGIDQITERVEKYQAITLSDQQSLAFAKAALTLRWENTAPIEPRQLLQYRRWDDRGSDLWRTVNRVQEALLKGGNRGRTETGKRTTTRAVTSISEDLRLNRSLFVLADALAEQVS